MSQIMSGWTVTQSKSLFYSIKKRLMQFGSGRSQITSQQNVFISLLHQIKYHVVVLISAFYLKSTWSPIFSPGLLDAKNAILISQCFGIGLLYVLLVGCFGACTGANREKCCTRCFPKWFGLSSIVIVRLLIIS